ncbi:MAG: fructose-1,6-bisphosphatase [Bacteroidales bacterium]|jgi:fructose-1,6-bisphosphatase-3|nr:fructose-1,6-bisphosphatase [Bacteroidales bacterium]
MNGTSHNEFTTEELLKDKRYLELLAERFPTIQKASMEIINLEAIMRLPKSTEHFLTDIHGEYETFTHVLRNASGVVRRKIEDVFGMSVRKSEKDALATLIYYPEEKMDMILQEESKENLSEWYMITLQRLSMIARAASSKYTRSKVRKTMPPDYAYIIDELLNESGQEKNEYYNEIIRTIIDIDRAEDFVVEISHFIQRLMIDRLHIIGDIYDRGPSAEKVMDVLLNHHAVDIQWGNHDIIWMGAASGCKALIATVLRISARYINLDTIEDAYGINLLPLATFAMEHYGNDSASVFEPKSSGNNNGKSLELIKQMHKAIAIIQFKLEAKLIKENPQFEMYDRLLLDKINYEEGTIIIGGIKYELLDKFFPTIDPNDPFKLSEEEDILMNRLQSSFLNSELLQKHIEVLYAKGSMYLAYNTNLLYHGCIPLNDEGSFYEMEIEGKMYKGKTLLDQLDIIARRAYFTCNKPNANPMDTAYLWYLWTGPYSPLFGKHRMTTFERYFIDDKKTHEEIQNPYYEFRNTEETCNMILNEFDLNPNTSHIINGHVPVKAKIGESPIKANGKLFVIDGGMSLPYQKVTGLSGYTLIYNSYGLILVEHKHFESIEEAIKNNLDIVSSRNIVETNATRKRVADTDIGVDLKEQVVDLKMLLAAYRKGLVKERV